ncbi:hypothetical protein BDM02DRAFT_3116516 [Thelephora ganbajun]|uniref:Uncharacterized protein n=1 Tax=Thelephora ganbajun TaxID=370292 RepID=A0ACB6ZEE0_THEGA|nr:hypothetical protein BDM02DRAFT_3116516 [Thelephora ganbajun]
MGGTPQCDNKTSDGRAGWDKPTILCKTPNVTPTTPRSDREDFRHECNKSATQLAQTSNSAVRC